MVWKTFFGYLLIIFLAALCWTNQAYAASCSRTLEADVVALDQLFFWNRLGVVHPQGMMYALKQDVVSRDGGASLAPGNVKLRSGKRPRPLVLRVNEGECLQINFTNLLNPSPVDDQQPATRAASVHITGLELVTSIADDASNVGVNSTSLAGPGDTATYTYYAIKEGTYTFHSAGAMTGGEGNNATIAAGLFGAVNVQKAGAEYYRSQVTEDDISLASTGTTAGGQPLVDYQAVYPADHVLAGRTIFNMVQGNKLVHSDLTAIITGPGAGRFPNGTYPPNATSPDRDRPFREFTIMYHDELGAVQAFPEFFDDPVLSHTLHSVRDGFAINYGTGGIGAEIIANRLGVGPVHSCTDCKYEEFFLTSWALGDPAMVVDIPANARDGAGNIIPGAKATKAFYPDDPSNVYHSYMSDQVKFRISHAGPKEHHIHHLHAHQWLHTPDSDNSAYLDSQALGPGSGFTLEIAYNGSGNRNQTVGDSIFHCHFYPHFAQGMWALWRVHDVFERGTTMDGNGRPAAQSRAYPDPEIMAGTPIPGIVPLPTLVMPPMPEADVEIVNGEVVVAGAGNPGYPFFIPGVTGHRPPRPPLDTIDDGGLPRHVIIGGTAIAVTTRLDFSKELVTAEVVEIPETGTPMEIAAMDFHAQRTHASYFPDGTPGDFITNGLPPVAGAPYADPCMNDAGVPTGNMRVYKAANIQIDAVINKAGWHFPQQRLITLWGDVQSTIDGTRPPEPFFMRANTDDCVQYQHTNLVPHFYEMDDFQVRTPTDILGQHIHLVKFDVTSSDGSANGWNYEDGTLAPGEVRERIHAIRLFNTCVGKDSGDPRDGSIVCPVAEAHPYFGPGPNGEWMGAMTTVQRWYADDVLNNLGDDRTLRTVFTHDHYGPSTHQQAGLYSGLVVEPQGSTWRDSETGEIMGGRFDGGPTSWRADILTADTADSYREFLIEFADMQLAYLPNGGAFPDPAAAINPPARIEVGLPNLLAKTLVCPGGVPLPCPEAISADDPGTMTVNYRNEPLALRVRDPATNQQAAGVAGDLSHAFRSDVVRADPALNVQPGFYPPLTGGVLPGDPYTPLMRAYEADKIQIRMLVGAQEEGHNFNVYGNKWMFEPSDPNSGYRGSQMMGISEHFEFQLAGLSAVKGALDHADYLYSPGSATDDLWNGTWGIMRAYNGAAGLQDDLLPLPNNPKGKAPKVKNARKFSGICPRSAPVRKISVTAATAAQIIPGGTLVYNSRPGNGGQLTDPTAIIYVRSKDIDKKTGQLKTSVPIEPLILRANAGDCLNIELVNKLPAVLSDLAGYDTLPMIVENFNANHLTPSSDVGLHVQLLAYNVGKSDGANIGTNPVQTVAPGGSVDYKWYAGDVKVEADGTRVATPIEFGTVNLMPSDSIKHASKGAFGALIIEPEGATWVEDADSRASATVTMADGSTYREFVVIFQNNVNLRFDDGDPVPLTAESEDPEDSGQKAINYRTEPMWKRMGFAPDAPLGSTRLVDFSNALSNAQVGGDPETPVFTAEAGTAIRMRILQPGGHARNHVFALHGHAWQEEPYVNDSKSIGSNPLSEVKGVQAGHGPTNHFDVVLKSAGGSFEVAGDYLYRDQASFTFDGGIWGILRVTPKAQ